MKPNLIAVNVVVAILSSLPCQAAEASKELENSDVLKIGAKLFPDYCGESGERCGYGYGGRSGSCPFEMWIAMPDMAQLVGWPKTIWVGLDEGKRPIALASHKKHGDTYCANRQRTS